MELIISPLNRFANGFHWVVITIAPLSKWSDDLIKITGWLGPIGDETLPSYMRVILSHEIRVPTNQPVFHGMLSGFGCRCSHGP